MGRGRKPDPQEVIDAGLRKKAKPIAFQAGAPVMPDWLSGDAKAKWEEIVPELLERGVLTPLDGAALTGLCVNYARALEAERIIAQQGSTYTNSDSDVTRRHPAVGIATEAWGVVMRYATELGLSPKSRSKLKTPPAQKESKLAKFLKVYPKDGPA